jgi:hypothetical protein
MTGAIGIQSGIPKALTKESINPTIHPHLKEEDSSPTRLKTEACTH